MRGLKGFKRAKGGMGFIFWVFKCAHCYSQTPLALKHIIYLNTIKRSGFHKFHKPPFGPHAHPLTPPHGTKIPAHLTTTRVGPQAGHTLPRLLQLGRYIAPFSAVRQTITNQYSPRELTIMVIPNQTSRIQSATVGFLQDTPSDDIRRGVPFSRAIANFGR